jgi:hypothetical protein
MRKDLANNFENERSTIINEAERKIKERDGQIL